MFFRLFGFYHSHYLLIFGLHFTCFFVHCFSGFSKHLVITPFVGSKWVQSRALEGIRGAALRISYFSLKSAICFCKNKGMTMITHYHFVLVRLLFTFVYVFLDEMIVIKKKNSNYKLSLQK